MARTSNVHFITAEFQGVRGRFTDREAVLWAAKHASGLHHPEIPVLLVSPIEDDYEALRGILAPPGFSLAAVHCVNEIGEALRRRHPVAVISDCRAGDWCWRDVKQAVQKLTRVPRLIVCSSRLDLKLLDEVFDSGADDLIARPFDREEVVCAIEDAWTRWACAIRMRAAGSL